MMQADPLGFFFTLSFTLGACLGGAWWCLRRWSQARHLLEPGEVLQIEHQVFDGGHIAHFLVSVERGLRAVGATLKADAKKASKPMPLGVGAYSALTSSGSAWNKSASSA